MKRISKKSKVCRAAPNFGVGRIGAWKACLPGSGRGGWKRDNHTCG